MPKDQPHYDIDEVLKMTPVQILGRLSNLEKDINIAKAHKKAQNDAAKDTIADLEGRKKELLDLIPQEFLGAPAGGDETLEDLFIAKGLPIPGKDGDK